MRKTFRNVKFKYTFRSYQQDVLDRLDDHGKDRRVNIVAAPGSGKTVLGLEIIRRQNAPSLVLSPSVTIRQQWGARFEELFVPEGEDKEGYVSYDLKAPALITCVTYQALHAAYNKLKGQGEADELTGDADAGDYTKFDLISVIKKAGIKTVCLDEAHHLRSEWQKALEGFMKDVQTDVYTVSLTATPPYDSTPAQWQRYESLCGEIDEEIFVPQLVMQKTLCPHQDYIYLTCPTEQETAAYTEFRKTTAKTLAEIFKGIYPEIITKSMLCGDFGKNEEYLSLSADKLLPVLICCKKCGAELPGRVTKLVTGGARLPIYKTVYAEEALELMLTDTTLFPEAYTAPLRRLLSERGLLDGGQVTLCSCPNLEKKLISSAGKLSGIDKIVRIESDRLGAGLRLLVLTDFIRKEQLSTVGGDTVYGEINTVSIFETIRRAGLENVRPAILSGGLVVVPESAYSEVQAQAALISVNVTKRPLVGVPFCEVNFSGSNKNKVEVLTRVFARGEVNALVGTKSLLGEGWDSPCINTLILASFVGAFMLSNQMRGRAIRTDKDAPDKTADIWHLLTVQTADTQGGRKVKKLLDPTDYTNKLQGEDYELLSRRFECFMAPSYSGGRIESGIGRLDVIAPPYDLEGIERINAQTENLCRNREALAEAWHVGEDSGKYEVVTETEVSDKVLPKSYVFVNGVNTAVFGTIFGVFLKAALKLLLNSGDLFVGILLSALAAVFGILTLIAAAAFLRFISPAATMRKLSKAALSALHELDSVESQTARVRVSADRIHSLIEVYLTGATAREKNVFTQTAEELFSPIGECRYVYYKKGKILFFNYNDYRTSFACPSVFGKNKETAEMFRKKLNSKAGKFEMKYVGSEEGREALRKCRRASFVNAAAFPSQGKTALKIKGR